MKKFIALLLAVVMLLTLCACGDKGANTDTDAGTTTEAAADPALGVYNGVSARMFGSTSMMTEVYDGTNSIELKKNGKCVVTLENESIDAEYTMEGEALNIVIQGENSAGTLKDDVLILDFMGLGMELIFVKDGAEIPADVLPAAARPNDDPNLVIGEGAEARYLESKIVENADGAPAIAAYFEYSNLGEEANSFGWSFYYTLTQNGQELDIATVFVGDDYSYLSESEYEDAEPGAIVEVCITYTLVDTTTPVVITFTDLFDTVLQEITVDLSAVETMASESTSIAGYYKILSFEEDGELYDLETLKLIGMDQTTFVVLNEDGTGRINFDGDESDVFYDDEILYNEGGDMAYYVEGDILTVLTGNLVFTYQKSDEEPPAPGSVSAANPFGEGEPFSAELAAEYAGDWHGMAVFYDVTGKYEHLLDQQMEILARFVFDEEGYCTPYLAAALGDDDKNFDSISASYNSFSEGMMLSGTFIGEELEDYSNAYTYYDTLYIDIYIDDGEGNYMNVYACLKRLDADWDEEVDYPCLPMAAVEFYKSLTMEEIVALFGLDPTALPALN